MGGVVAEELIYYMTSQSSRLSQINTSYVKLRIYFDGLLRWLGGVSKSISGESLCKGSEA